MSRSGKEEPPQIDGLGAMLADDATKREQDAAGRSAAQSKTPEEQPAKPAAKPSTPPKSAADDLLAEAVAHAVKYGVPPERAEALVHAAMAENPDCKSAPTIAQAAHRLHRQAEVQPPEEVEDENGVSEGSGEAEQPSGTSAGANGNKEKSEGAQSPAAASGNGGPAAAADSGAAPTIVTRSLEGELGIHSLAELFPPLPEAELDKLAESIKKEHQQQPVVLWDGKVIDGRCRYLACRKAGVPVLVTDRKFGNEAEAAAYVVSANLMRRHLSTSQRAVLARQLQDLISKVRKAGTGAVADLPPQGKARDAAAAQLKVSPRLVQAAKTVQEKGSEGLKQAVDMGIAKVSTAAVIASLPKKYQDDIVDLGPEAIKDEAARLREEAKLRKLKGHGARSSALSALPPIEAYYPGLRHEAEELAKRKKLPLPPAYPQATGVPGLSDEMDTAKDAVLKEAAGLAGLSVKGVGIVGPLDYARYRNSFDKKVRDVVAGATKAGEIGLVVVVTLSPCDKATKPQKESPKTKSGGKSKKAKRGGAK